MRILKLIRTACFSLAFHPFCWGLHFVHKADLTEFAKEQAVTIWWLRVACFTLSYHRML